jgi:hypothetical protein
MKYIDKMTACQRAPRACVLICTLALALASCGGGAGGTTATPMTQTTILDGFFQMMPDLSFLWTTSKQVNVGITLSRASNAALGDLTVVLSNSTCDDPTGGDQLAHPIRTSVFIAYPLTVTPVNQQTAASATLGLGQLQLQIPDATSYVLVEVLDNTNPSLELYSKLVRPADLPSLNIVIALPQPRDTTTGEPLDPAQSPLASCPTPG